MKTLPNPIRILFVAATMVLALGAMAAPKSNRTSQAVPQFPGTLVNARFVYVTSYDGDLFNANLLPEDRQAITTVQDAMQKWGKFTLVYDARKADIVLAVQSRTDEDVLAVYDAREWPEGGPYLWRMMGRSGLQASESPFVTNLEIAFERATKK
jgi:hypothetical protein